MFELLKHSTKSSQIITESFNNRRTIIVLCRYTYFICILSFTSKCNMGNILLILRRQIPPATTWPQMWQLVSTSKKTRQQQKVLINVSFSLRPADTIRSFFGICWHFKTNICDRSKKWAICLSRRMHVQLLSVKIRFDKKLFCSFW